MDENYKVYVHISPSNKLYIGITKQEVKKRWQNGNGYRHNIYFTNAIKHYGWDNFEHIVLFENLPGNVAKEIEISLIKKYKTNNSTYGYNITSGGEGTKGLSGKLHPFYGKKLSKEHRLHLSMSQRQARKNIKDTSIYAQFGANNHFSKQVYCFELNEHFECVSDVVKKYGFNRDSIIKCCNHTQLTTGVYNNLKLHWIYDLDYYNIFDKCKNNDVVLKKHIDLFKSNKKEIHRNHSEETKCKMRKNHADVSGVKNPSAKAVYCYELDEYFSTMKDVYVKYHIDPNSICLCCSGKRNSAGKHPIYNTKLHWKYA